MDEQTTLSALAAHAGKLVESVSAQSADSLGEQHDDPRWPYRLPLRYEIQSRVLLNQSLDACDVAAFLLRSRVSTQALSAVRFLAESFVALRWLAEPRSEPARQQRGSQILFSTLDRIRDNLRKHEVETTESPGTLKSLDEMESLLRSLASEDGYVLKRPPGRQVLFERYLDGPGYSLFWTLSELGSHPGTVQLLLFDREPGTRRLHVDLEGSHIERSYWCAMAIDLLGRTCDVATDLFQWQSWRQQTVLPLVQAALPDLKEAVRRWTEKWGISISIEPSEHPESGSSE
jgi:hypothetical protein